jgi:predicted N-acetyltransferase YhbS
MNELPLVHRLMNEAFEEYRGVLDPPSGAHAEAVDDVRASAAKGGAFLGLIDGEPMGSVRYEIRGDQLFCSRLSVVPMARGRGLGRAMMLRIHERAKELDATEVRLFSREILISNMRLYESMGYHLVSRQQSASGGGVIVEFSLRMRHDEP